VQMTGLKDEWRHANMRTEVCRGGADPQLHSWVAAALWTSPACVLASGTGAERLCAEQHGMALCANMELVIHRERGDCTRLRRHMNRARMRMRLFLELDFGSLRLWEF